MDSPNTVNPLSTRRYYRRCSSFLLRTWNCVRTVIVDGLLEDGQLMVDIAKYGDVNAFWRLSEEVYAYPLDDQDLKLLAMSLVLKAYVGYV